MGPTDIPPLPPFPKVPPPLPPLRVHAIEPAPRPGGARRRTVWLIALALAVPATGLGYLGWRQYRRSALPPLVTETAEQKYASVRLAFDATGAAALPPADAQALDALLQQVARAIAAGDGTALTRELDFDRMVQEVKRLGGVGPMPKQEEQALIRGLEIGLGRSISGQAAELRWQKLEIRALHPLAGAQEAVIYIRASAPDGVKGKLRYWVRRQGNGGWRIYDWEDLDTGVRMTTLMSSLTRQLSPNAPVPSWLGSLQNLPKVTNAIAAGDHVTAEKLLDEMADASLPAQVESVRWQMMTVLRARQGRWEDALECVKQAEAIGSDAPALHQFAAMSLNALGRHEEAVERATKYLKLMGADTEAYFQLGTALERLGRIKEAADAYRKGLNDDADTMANAAGLARMEPDGEDWAARLKKVSAPMRPQFFVSVATEVGERAKVETLESFVQAQRMLQPTDLNVAYYDAWAKLRRERPAEAMAVLEPLLSRVTDEQGRGEFFNLYGRAVIEGGAVMAAYQRSDHRSDFFGVLGTGLQMRQRWADLAELASAHRAAEPRDVWGPYYQGLALAHEGMGEAADKAFADALKLAATREARDMVWQMRLWSGYESGRTLQVYAQADDRDEAFLQLAQLCAADGKGDELNRLLGAHAKARPTDASLVTWHAEVSWLKEDYAGVVLKLRGGKAHINPADVWRTRDRLVRSLVRLGRFDEAATEEKAGRMAEEDRWLSIVILAASGKHEEAAGLLEKEVAGDPLLLEEVYADVDLAAPLKSAGFAAFRAKHPEPKGEVKQE